MPEPGSVNPHLVVGVGLLVALLVVAGVGVWKKSIPSYALVAIVAVIGIAAWASIIPEEGLIVDTPKGGSWHVHLDTPAKGDLEVIDCAVKEGLAVGEVVNVGAAPVNGVLSVTFLKKYKDGNTYYTADRNVVVPVSNVERGEVRHWTTYVASTDGATACDAKVLKARRVGVNGTPTATSTTSTTAPLASVVAADSSAAGFGSERKRGFKEITLQ
jgi:hypothetical protein